VTFEHSIDIAAAPDALFALTQDYARRLEWDPFLKSAELLGFATEAAKGVRAYCVSRSGLGMETEDVSFNPPRTCAVKMTAGPRLIGSFAGSWRFEEAAPGQTRVTFPFHLEARPRWLAPVLTPFLHRVFALDTRRRLDALKDAVEQRGLLRKEQSLGGGPAARYARGL
jgi:ribosome-associated toxin RatA of RatAB toxin-antitoxin module